MHKSIIYQMLPRLWGSYSIKSKKNGSLAENGCGKFSDIDKDSLEYIKWLGCDYIWYTGIIRHSTQEEIADCPASHIDIVKGRAGSPYAICDYYDVNPYLADNPMDRMDEFKALIKRTHDEGLKVIIDFVPNHVSRDYGKVGFVEEGKRPKLGENDDKNVHWSPDNDFFYYPGQSLVLPSNNAETPYEEFPAIATGNNCFHPNPSINDWYETIKINYCDRHTATWDKMLDILMFWAEKGVDGFRCDMVELVPTQFFEWAISKVKEVYPDVIFIAEVYNKEDYRKFIKEVGFDMLYDKEGLYDTIRSIVEKNVNDNGMPVEMWQSATGITRNWQMLGDLQPYMLNFLENHDEQRFASDFFGKDANNTFAPLYISLYFNVSPFMIYFGEEIGEKGMDEEGFCGLNGRTTIFDWWQVESIRRLMKLIKSKEYKTLDIKKISEAGLREDEAEFFCNFVKAIQYANSEGAINKGNFYDLCYSNLGAEGFDKDRHFIFLRDYEDQTILVAANFSVHTANMKIKIPLHAFEWMEIPITERCNPEKVIEIKVPPMSGTTIKLCGGTQKE